MFETDKLGAYDIGVLLANSGIAVRIRFPAPTPNETYMERKVSAAYIFVFYNTKAEIEYIWQRGWNGSAGGEANG